MAMVGDVGAFSAQRAALADAAARLAAAGRAPAPLLPRLCRLTTAELLAAPAPAVPPSIDLAAECRALCEAAGEAVRRRPGWLCARVWAGPLTAAVSVRVLRAAVLSVWAAALRAGVPAVVGCRPSAGGAVLWVGGARPAAAQAPLLRRLAAGGGTVLYTANAPFTAVLRLPPACAAPKTASQAETLLADRYSLLYQYLAGFCAGPAL